MNREMLGYAIAAVCLVVFGVILRTPVLNWISGPAIVVAVVTTVARERK